jgi:anti-sigma-K factor RskA
MGVDAHAQQREDLAAYLLDALEPEEVQEFERHLAGCARCQGEERWLRAVIELLPSSVEQFEPPPALRERLLDTVRAEAAADKAPPRERRARRPWFALGLRPAVALASLAIAAAGLAGYLIGNDNGPKTTTVQAQVTKAEPSASAQLIRTGDTAVLRVERLRVPPPGRVYEVWLARGKQVEPSSLFAVRQNGSGEAAITGKLRGVGAVMVSEEPRGGSSKPTSKPLLIAKL